MIRKLVSAVAVATLAMGLCQCAKPPVPMTNYDYDVVISLTPAAAEAVKSAKDSVVAQAHYYGLATKASRDRADSIGQISLGDSQSAGTYEARRISMQFSVPTGDLSDLGEQQAFSLVVVYATKPIGTQDEQLKCTSYRGPVPTKAKPAEIRCDLNTVPD